MHIWGIGELAIVNDLTRQGWTDVKLNTRGLGAADIQAKNPEGQTQLFQLNTAAVPNSPEDLSASEKAAIKSKAKRLGAVAFEVKIQLDANFAVRSISYVLL